MTDNKEQESTQPPTQEPNNDKTNELHATIETTSKIYTDQTSQFPVTSSRGNQYDVMVIQI
jgi:hypothetical protein